MRNKMNKFMRIGTVSSLLVALLLITTLSFAAQRTVASGGLASGTKDINDNFTELFVKHSFSSKTADYTATAALNNGAIVQMTTVAELTFWDCETANIGDSLTLHTKDAEVTSGVPASGDHFTLKIGTALTAGNEIDTSGTAGDNVLFVCTADDTWSVIRESGTTIDGGTAD
jgi:hypothetical protein